MYVLLQVPKGEKCVHSVSNDISESLPEFDNARIKLESSPLGADHTQVKFIRLIGT